MFSNDTYTVMNTPSAEHSRYDEHTDGASTQFTTRLVSRNVISGSFFFKDDTHRESWHLSGPVAFSAGRAVITRPGSAGLHRPSGCDHDYFHVFMPLLVSAPTISMACKARPTTTRLTGFVPFTCIASPTNTSVAGCTLHAWNYNPQASLSYQVSKSGNLFVTFADRGRFPMLKDIYSASLGLRPAKPQSEARAQPKLEHRVFAGAFGCETLMQVELFRSDLRDAIESVAVTDPGNPTALGSASPPPHYAPPARPVIALKM